MARNFRRLADPGVRTLTATRRWVIPGLGIRLIWHPGQGVVVRPIGRGARQRLLALVADLMQHGRDLKRCPQCGTPFLGPGKRLFCSPRCTRAAMDARRAERRMAAHERQTERRYRRIRQRLMQQKS